jgi:hypothetical protein
VTCNPQAIDAVRECVHEFVGTLSSECAVVCESDSKKIIRPQHVCMALRQLEFAAYADELDSAYAGLEAGQATHATRKRKRKHATDLGISTEELEREQKALFDAARAAALNDCP